MSIIRAMSLNLVIGLVGCSGGIESPPMSSEGNSLSTGIICLQGCTVVDPDAPLRVTLTASQVIEGSAETGNAAGRVTIDRSTGELRGVLTFTGIEPVTVTLNRGYAGESGPLLWNLEFDGAGTWSMPAHAMLIPTDIDVLDAGGMYISATTTQSPGGAVRGQIIRSGAAQVRFMDFSSPQVVPPFQSSATATGAVTVSAPVLPSGYVSHGETYVIHANGAVLADAFAVHAHHAFPGENGPRLLDLKQDPGNVTHWYSGSISGARSGIQAAYDRSLLYIDVHTSSHPDGIVRGQIGRWNNISHVELSGGDVVPPVATADWGTAATITTDLVGWDWIPEITMHVNLQGLDEATAVTINYAPHGENGPLIHSLVQDSLDRSHWRIERALLDDTELSGSFGWYVNVTTPEHPDGEVRGQLVPELVEN